MTKYKGTNVVTTNSSADNHGRPATMNVTFRGSAVRFTHSIDNGGNVYGIDINRYDALPALVAQLIPQCPKAALPQLLGAIGSVIAAEDTQGDRKGA